MAWEELDFDKPHLAYAIIGGFTSLFMLCSLFIKEKIYIGEATVATLVGVIFGPHAANLLNPLTWGNTDKITLELSRIVLVVQCFAVGVELPKAYMERHWRSVTFLLVPIMTFGWLITSLIVWVCISPLSWLESLAIAGCVTATDPVLASSVVGKGKFAKRVPKHLRDLLSAESGCNDGMAFPFIYLSYYLIHYNLQAGEVTFHWIVILILYECIFGAVYGFIIGYIGRHAIKFAERNNLIDRDSFLVFYFVLALFCSGTAAGLGLDDLLVGFSAGVGFSNDGWFVEKTEESHVSNVIDLLLNLSYFVYLGAIIPWQDYNNAAIGLVPWRLVLIAILVILFRRIPAMMAFKPLIPDIKNWREALFAGHFGPIGVGAVFAAILLRAELETGTTEPDDPNSPGFPPADNPNALLIQTLWPIVSFLVISSILVHGSSIAVFTLGKRINTLTLSISYTQADEPNWMDRLPRIASRSKSMSRNSNLSDDVSDEKMEFQPGTLGPVGIPRNFLRRQREGDDSRPGSRPTSRASRSRKKWSDAGGPVDESAIAPVWRQELERDPERGELPKSGAESPATPEREEGAGKQREEADGTPDGTPDGRGSPEIEAYQEGHQMIVEDEEGNVLETRDIRGESPEQVREDLLADRNALRKETSGEHAKSKHHPHERNEGEEIQQQVAGDIEHPKAAWKKWLGQAKGDAKPKEKAKPKQHRGAAQAYQYGDKIIVEDADGEVVKTYDIPRAPKAIKQSVQQQQGSDPEQQQERPGLRRGITRMGTWTGLSRMASRTDKPTGAGEGPSDEKPQSDEAKQDGDDANDRGVRFRVRGSDRRMSKQDFIKQIQALEPQARVQVVDQVQAPEELKKDVKQQSEIERRLSEQAGEDGGFLSRKRSRKQSTVAELIQEDDSKPTSRSPRRRHLHSDDRPVHHPHPRNRSAGSSTASEEEEHKPVPTHDVSKSIASASEGLPETAAQRRRRLAALAQQQQADSDDDGTDRVVPHARQRRPSAALLDTDVETAAERRRRLAALGKADDASDSEDNGRPRRPSEGATEASIPSPPIDVQQPPRALLRRLELLPPGSPTSIGSDGEDAADGAESPRSPGIRFADMPRGEGRGRSRRFGRTMGMMRR